MTAEQAAEPSLSDALRTATVRRLEDHLAAGQPLSRQTMIETAVELVILRAVLAELANSPAEIRQ